MLKIDKEAMRELFEMEAVTVGNALTSLLGRTVKISVLDVAETGVRELPEHLPHFHVILPGIRLSEGQEAGQIYIYAKEDIVKLTNFIMGLPVDAMSPLDEIALSTIREVMTQCMQAGAGELGAFLGREQDAVFSGIDTADNMGKVEALIDSWGEKGVLCTTYSLSVEGVATINLYGIYSMKLAELLGMTDLVSMETVADQEKKKGMIAVQDVLFPEFKYTPIEYTTEQFGPEHARLMDIELEVAVRIGSTLCSVKDVLNLKQGQVLTLDKQAGSPADVVVNGRLIGKGDVLVTGEHFGTRITEILAKEK